MPFVEPPRKRRRDDQGEEFLYNFFSPKRAQQDQLNSPREWPIRKVIPLPSKRARFDYRPQEHMLHEKQYDTFARQKSKGTSLLLTPCHICGDHPSRASQLDAFAHCQGCGEWTCYVCIRQCQGWIDEEESHASMILGQEVLSRSFEMKNFDDGNVSPKTRIPYGEETQRTAGGASWKAKGHQSIICRGCCVEPKETDGEVACLGCYHQFAATIGV